MVKLLGLDIDGVLNSTASVHAKIGVLCSSSAQQEAALKLIDLVGDLPYGAKFALQCADPVAVGLVNRLLKESEAGLLLMSTHRKHFSDNIQYGSNQHLEYLRLYLTAMGINVPEMFSITAALHRQRGEEVENWMNMAWENGIDVESYVLLDDGSDFLDGQPLVLCDANDGFTFKKYVEACKLLGTKEPGLILL